MIEKNSQENLDCAEVPQPPRDIKISETWSRSASISWTPPYSGNSPITKYTVQYWRVSTSHRLEEMEVAGTQNSVLLQDLKPGISYQVSIVADNAVGSSQPSSAMSFTTSEEGKSELLALLKKRRGLSTG